MTVLPESEESRAGGRPTALQCPRGRRWSLAQGVCPAKVADGVRGARGVRHLLVPGARPSGGRGRLGRRWAARLGCLVPATPGLEAKGGRNDPPFRTLRWGCGLTASSLVAAPGPGVCPAQSFVLPKMTVHPLTRPPATAPLGAPPELAPLDPTQPLHVPGVPRAAAGSHCSPGSAGGTASSLRGHRAGAVRAAVAAAFTPQRLRTAGIPNPQSPLSD